MSFSLVVLGALLFTREMNNAISKALRTSRPIKLHEALREEISRWLFLRTWDDPLPGEMNVISAYPLQQMPQPQVGVVQ